MNINALQISRLISNTEIAVLSLLHSELYEVLAVLSAVGLRSILDCQVKRFHMLKCKGYRVAMPTHSLVSCWRGHRQTVTVCTYYGLIPFSLLQNTELQISGITEDNSKIIFLISK